MAPKKLRRMDYQVAWICPVSNLELLPSALMLDEEHDAPDYDTAYDDNVYTCGVMAGHNVVLATCPPGLTGDVNAGRVTGAMFKTFPNIRMTVLVGIGGGVPRSPPSDDPTEDVHLGDVVVGWPGDGGPACVYYDLGRWRVDGQFETLGTIDKPDRVLLNALGKLALDYDMDKSTFNKYQQRLLVSRHKRKFTRPNLDYDRLFHASYRHEGQYRDKCGSCDTSQLVDRPTRTAEEADSCLVIRGISDYSDSHKNDVWRSYAAGNAAVFARELLGKVPPGTVAGMETMGETVPFIVPFARNQHFSGRFDAFQQLDMFWSRAVALRLSVHGLGGCGKSALATEFAYRLREQQPDCAVFWVPALTQQTFEQAYREIGKLLKIPQICNGQADNGVDVNRLVKDQLDDEKSGPWLMVVDNADDSHVLLDCLQTTPERRLIDYLPQRRGFILFTTRRRKTAFQLAGSNLVPLEELSKEEAPGFLSKRLTGSDLLDDETVVQHFLEMLAYLPLAIVQAVAFIIENDLTLQRYIGLFNEARASGVHLLRRKFTDETRYLNANNAVATTWYISFDQIRRDDRLAADYLTFMACLRRENIPLSILPPNSTIATVEAIGTLKAYAFVAERVQQKGQEMTDAESYDIHRLVHLATQEWMQDRGEWDDRIDEVLRRLIDVIPYGDHETSKIWVHYLEHGLQVAGLADHHQSMALERISLLDRIGRCQHEVGQYKAAETTRRETLVFRIKTFGKENPDTLMSMSCLGQVLRSQGKYGEAEKIHREELALREKVLGREHPDTQTSMSCLGQVLSSQGRYEEAEKIHREELALRLKVSGREHPSTQTSISNLGQVLDS